MLKVNEFLGESSDAFHSRFPLKKGGGDYHVHEKEFGNESAASGHHQAIHTHLVSHGFQKTGDGSYYNKTNRHQVELTHDGNKVKAKYYA